MYLFYTFVQIKTPSLILLLVSGCSQADLVTLCYMFCDLFFSSGGGEPEEAGRNNPTADDWVWERHCKAAGTFKPRIWSIFAWLTTEYKSMSESMQTLRSQHARTKCLLVRQNTGSEQRFQTDVKNELFRNMPKGQWHNIPSHVSCTHSDYCIY